jgi:hypothetical protein
MTISIQPIAKLKDVSPDPDCVDCGYARSRLHPVAGMAAANPRHSLSQKRRLLHFVSARPILAAASCDCPPAARRRERFVRWTFEPVGFPKHKPHPTASESRRTTFKTRPWARRPALPLLVEGIASRYIDRWSPCPVGADTLFGRTNFLRRLQTDHPIRGSADFQIGPSFCTPRARRFLVRFPAVDTERVRSLADGRTHVGLDNHGGSMSVIDDLRCTALAFGLMGLLLGVADTHAAEDIAPFLEKYCVDCHTGPDGEAGIDLSLLQEATGVGGHRETWERTLRILNIAGMPPEDYDPQPSEQEREKILALIDSMLHEVDCDVVNDVGRVTIRRLNRIEYNNTIRDLVGIDI